MAKKRNVKSEDDSQKIEGNVQEQEQDVESSECLESEVPKVEEESQDQEQGQDVESSESPELGLPKVEEENQETEEDEKHPVVSVLITVKNTEKEWLEKALHSVLSQDFEEKFEIILVDDASKEEYSAWLEALVFGNEKITLLRKSVSIGRGPALNEGIALCTGEFIGKMDSDDIAEPNWLREMVAFMREHKDAVVAGCQIKFFGEQVGRVTTHPLMQTSKNILNYPKNYFWVINHPGCMFRTEALVELGGYGEFTEYAEEVSEDFDLWCRILKAGHSIYTNQKVLVNYRYVSKPERYSKVWYEFLEARKAGLKK